MNREKENRVFKVNETGYHKSAKLILAEWVNGIPEYPLTVRGAYVIVPDVVCFIDGILNCAYEVTYKNPLSGRKLGLYEYWAYMNNTTLAVFEVNADYILKQTEKPSFIKSEYYIIDPYNFEQCTF